MQISEQSMAGTGARNAVSAWSQTLWIVVFAAATAVSARVDIPHQPVPYTLQSMMVLLAGAFLGARNGALSQCMYLLVGALGAPVFALGGFGLTRLLGPTGGYLLAFPLAAAVVGLVIGQRRSLPWTFLAMILGSLVIFLGGTLQLRTVVFTNWTDAFTSGFLIFSWWDVLKISAAAMTYHEVAKRWPRLS